jgi:hypothetical protein
MSDKKKVIVKWANVKKTCRIAFCFPNDDSVYTLERDIPWDMDKLYDIEERTESLLHTEDARKLWRLLCKNHTFYKKEIDNQE